MAISTYSELQTAVATWMERNDSGFTSNVVDMITLAEARLNRKIELVETSADLTGTAGSRNVSISALEVIEPMRVFIADAAGEDEIEIDLKAPGTFPFEETSGVPGYVSADGDNLVFDRPLDAAYAIRFRYRGRFALSDAAPTNDLLTYHPDVYLAACVMWGGVFVRDTTAAATFKAILDEFTKETRGHLSQRRRGVSSPDPALARMSTPNRRYWDGNL